MRTAALMKSVSMATHKNGAHVSVRDCSERSVKMTKTFFFLILSWYNFIAITHCVCKNEANSITSALSAICLFFLRSLKLLLKFRLAIRNALSVSN